MQQLSHSGDRCLQEPTRTNEGFLDSQRMVGRGGIPVKWWRLVCEQAVVWIENVADQQCPINLGKVANDPRHSKARIVHFWHHGRHRMQQLMCCCSQHQSQHALVDHSGNGLGTGSCRVADATSCHLQNLLASASVTIKGPTVVGTLKESGCHDVTFRQRCHLVRTLITEGHGFLRVLDRVHSNDVVHIKQRALVGWLGRKSQTQPTGYQCCE